MRLIESLGAQILAARKARGWSQVELARRAWDYGDNGSISRLERGISPMGLQRAIYVIAALGLRIELRDPSR